MYACSNDNIQIKVLKLLENNGANIHKIEANGCNIFLLVLYSNKKQIKVLEHLKSKGINIHNVNIFNKNACFYADNVKILKYLESIGINIHYKHKYSGDNFYSNIVKYSDQRDKNTIKLLKYLKSRGVQTYYSNNYKYCDYCGYYKILKHLLISNCNNRYKTIVCYI
jgi:ACT domain-containing protein